MDCNHKWEWVRDWEGDPNVVNGIRRFSYWRCIECDATDNDEPAPGPDPDYLRDRDIDDRLTGA